MKHRTTGVVGMGLIAGVCLSLGGAYPAAAQAAASAPAARQDTIQKGAAAMSHARGTFDVKLVPQTMEDTPESAGLGRMTIDKQFQGDLTGSSKGQMLTGGGSVKGSAGYVAMEKVTGTLQGRSGSFILQHTGTMSQGNYHLSVTVVPDSGTGQLTGLAGTLNIIIAPDGGHSYDFDYTLAATP